MTDFAIIGAGMAGLYAGRLLTDAGHSVRVYEAQPDLPNNHSAVLRFREDSVGLRAGIPFRPVNMIKATAHHFGPVGDALSYSFKATGQSRSDRSLPTEPVTARRYIAPPDFIARLAEPLDISFGVRVDADWLYQRSVDGTKIVSTIPLPVLANITGHPQRKQINAQARYRQLTNVVGTVPDCDAYASVYIPDPHSPVLRASVTGDWLTLECSSEPTTAQTDRALNALGLSYNRVTTVEFKAQQYGKILPMDAHLRRRFISWATDEWDVYSLGRFATWRPGLLLEQLTRDIQLISGWAANSDGDYELKLERAKQEERNHAR